MKTYIPALTGVRAIAAFLVVLHHLLGGGFASDYMNSIFRELNVGVNMFFVLSGFLIWFRYADNFEWKKKWFKKYLLNRVARIYPMYFLWTSVVMTLGFFAYNQNLHQFLFTYILNITFLNGFSSEYVYTGIAQGWTLSVEELFYLSAPLLFMFNIRKKWPLLILGIGIALVGLLLYVIFRNFDFYGFFNNLQVIKITSYFGRFPEFFIGIMLAKLVKSKEWKERTLPVFTTIGIVFIMTSIILILPSMQTGTAHYSIQTNIGFLFLVVVFPIFVSILFYGLITETSILNRILSSKPFLLLGKSSYALYLVHWGMTSYLIHRFFSENIYITIFITYMLSILLWRYFEEPANSYIRKKYTQSIR